MHGPCFFDIAHAWSLPHRSWPRRASCTLCARATRCERGLRGRAREDESFRPKQNRLHTESAYEVRAQSSGFGAHGQRSTLAHTPASTKTVYLQGFGIRAQSSAFGAHGQRFTPCPHPGVEEDGESVYTPMVPLGDDFDRVFNPSQDQDVGIQSLPRPRATGLGV